MDDDKPYVNLLKRHLEATTKMLVKIIEYCPYELWIQSSNGPPLWQQI